MIEWLQKYSGLQTRGNNIEKIELNNLRKEMRHYQKKYGNESKEMMVNSDDEEEENEKQKEKKEISPEEQKQIDENIKKKRQKNKKPRETISSEVYGEFNKGKSFVKIESENTEDQKERLKKNCEKCFLFNIDDNDLNTITETFKMKNVAPDETVYKQNDMGNKIYLIESGELDCLKTFRKGDPPTFIKTYKAGEFLGITSLLYNAPRDSTVIAKKESVLWTLDREKFRNILKTSNIQKREKYLEILKDVDILQNFEINELNQICDIIKERKLSSGSDIIKQGAIANDFFILIEGKCHAEKVAEKDKDKEKAPSTVIKEFLPLDCFLENALFKGEPTIASVVADTDCVLLSINRMALKRILGPIENILKRKYEVYVRFMKK